MAAWKAIVVLISLSLSTEAAATKPLYLLSLLPYPSTPPDPQPSEIDGPSLFIAGELAVQSINNNSAVLPGYHLELLRGSTGCNIVNTAVLGFVDSFLYSSENIVGIVGPACSTSAELLLPLTNHPETAVVSVHIASLPVLGQRDRFRYSFGTLDSSELFVSVLLELVEQNNWYTISILYDDSRSFYSSIVSGLRREFSDRDDNHNVIITESPIHEFVTSAALGLSQNRVIFLLVGADLFSNVVCSIFHGQPPLVYPSYQWVIVGRVLYELVPVRITVDGREFDCSREQLREALDRCVFINDRILPLDICSETVAGKSAAELLVEYLKAVEQQNITGAPSHWAAVYYDSVWALALALNNSMTQVNLSRYSYGQEQATIVIQQQLSQLAFDGFSGHIAFNQSTGFVSRFADIFQVVDNSLCPVGYYNGSALVNDSGRYIESSFAVSISTASLALCVVLFVCMTVLVVLVVVCHVLTVLYASHHSVKATSPHLTHMAYIGYYIFSVHFIVLVVSRSFIFSPKVYCGLSMSALAVGSIGASLIFATICARTFRIYRIFVHYLHPGRFVSDAYLFLFIFLVLAFFVGMGTIGLIVWATFAIPPEVIEVPSGDTVYLKVKCGGPRDLWIVFYNGMLVFVSVVLATLSLKAVKQHDFKTNFVLLLAYMETLIGIPVLVMLTITAETAVDPDLELAILGLSYLALMSVFLGLLFAPPLVPVIKPTLQRWRRTVRSKYSAMVEQKSKEQDN